MPRLGISLGLDLVQRGSHLKQNITIPDGFIHPMGTFVITKSGQLATIENATINDYRKVLASPVIKYVNWSTGVDTNDGNSEGTAYKTLTKLNGVTFDRAYVAAGNYGITSSIQIYRYDAEVFGVGGEAGMCRGWAGNELTWSDLGGGSFSVNIANNPVSIIDSEQVDADGVTLRLTAVASAELVASTTNSYYRDGTSTTLYIHLLSGLQPGNNIIIPIGAMNIGVGKITYMENVIIYGGFTGSTNSTATKNVLLAKNCEYNHTYGSNCLVVVGNYWVWFENVIGQKASLDALNYNGSGAYNPAIVEVNCIGRYSGIGAAKGINNGSTSHAASIILRLNGYYHDTEGPAVHDILSAKSLNVCCKAEKSTSTVVGNKSAFAVASAVGETTTMWLDSCTGGSETTFGAENRAVGTAHIYAKNSTITNVEVGTTVETY